MSMTGCQVQLSCVQATVYSMDVNVTPDGIVLTCREAREEKRVGVQVQVVSSVVRTSFRTPSPEGPEPWHPAMACDTGNITWSSLFPLAYSPLRYVIPRPRTHQLAWLLHAAGVANPCTRTLSV